MGKDPRTSLARLLALSGAILLIAGSASLGAYYGYTVGAHVHVMLGAIFAAAALGGEILKPLAVLGAVDALRASQWLRAFIAAGLASTCIMYSLTAELSLAAGSRGDLASSRQATNDLVVRAQDRRSRAIAELHGLEAARPASALAPMISALKATPGANSCLLPPDGPISRRVCGEAAKLETEAARFNRRSELQEQIDAADSILDSRSGQVGAADPLASTLSAYALSLGKEIDPREISPWLALIPVLFLEIGSAFALVVARQVGAPGPDSPPAAPSASKPRGSGQPDTERTGTNENDNPPEDGGLGGKVVDLIAVNGGKLEGGQRGIAKALGVSKSRLNELLHDLARTGAIHLTTCSNGTTVRLAQA